MPRIALIHALAHSMRPINDAMVRAWPEATRMNLLDDTLSLDLAHAGALDDSIRTRFLDLARYAVSTGVDAILFTCSAFGPCIEAVASAHSAIPVLKPNEALIADAIAAGGKLGLVATFAPTLATMPQEFGNAIEVEPGLAEGALEALARGDTAAHDALVASAAKRLLLKGCTQIALAQFSMARAERECVNACGVPILTTVESAVQALRRRLG